MMAIEFQNETIQIFATLPAGWIRALLGQLTQVYRRLEFPRNPGLRFARAMMLDCLAKLDSDVKI
jgi:hypothetical protein